MSLLKTYQNLMKNKNTDIKYSTTQKQHKSGFPINKYLESTNATDFIHP